MRTVTAHLLSRLNLLGLSVLMSATCALAGNTPPDFDETKWTKLLDRIVEHGTPMETDEGHWRILSHVVPDDRAKPRHADYISTIGSYDAAGEYVPGVVSDVSENWQIKDGNWDIDQWHFLVLTTGELIWVEHNHLVETMEGRVLDYQSLPTGAVSDPVELQHWGQVLEQWYLP